MHQERLERLQHAPLQTMDREDVRFLYHVTFDVAVAHEPGLMVMIEHLEAHDEGTDNVRDEPLPEAPTRKAEQYQRTEDSLVRAVGAMTDDQREQYDNTRLRKADSHAWPKTINCALQHRRKGHGIAAWYLG